MPRWTPYIACAAVVLIVSLCYFLFPNVETRTSTKKVSPYETYVFLEEFEEQITADGLMVHCVTSESRKGVRENPQDGDVIVQVCSASRPAPVG